LITTVSVSAQRFIKFTASECLQECRNHSSKVEEIKEVKTLTTIRLKTYAPCGGNFIGDIKMDCLIDLRFSIKPIIVRISTVKLLNCWRLQSAIAYIDLHIK